MEPNVQRKARELADALAASDAYQKLQAARDEISEHEAAQIMLRDFLAKQQKLQERVMRGDQPSEAEMADFEQTAQIVGINPYIQKLIQAEMAFSDMMMEVQRELAHAVGLELPEEAEIGAPPEQQPDQPARSNLWVPGRD